MPTLYVENVPKALYEGLRRRARQNHRSIAAEVLSLLRENVPTEEELRKRRRFFEQVKKRQSAKPLSPGPFQTTEEMQREDRDR